MGKFFNSFLNRSLSLQLSLLVVIVSAIVLTSFGWYRYRLQAKEMEGELKQNLEITANALATSLSQSIFNYDLESVESICMAIINKQEVISLIIDDIDEENYITLLKNEKNEIKKIEKSNIKGNYFWFKKKILFNDQTIAVLNIAVTKIYLNKALESIMKSIVIQIIALELLLVIPLFILLRFRFIIPLQQLTKISSRISEGDLDQKEVNYGNNEIGTLAKTFFIMKNSIKRTIVELNREVIDRKEGEKEIRLLRNYLNNIIDSMPSILIGVDANCRVTQWNKKAEQTTGIKPVDALGKKVSTVYPHVGQEIVKIRESIKEMEIKQSLKNQFQSDQRLLYEDITIYPLTADGIEGAVIRIDDVTEKILMEEVMIQSEKMLSVGGLAAGMAHEINNPLAGMMQTANVMANRLGKKPNLPANLKAAEKAGTTMEAIVNFMESREIARMLQTINESGRRIAGIVDNMLSFSRKSETSVAPENLSDLLDKTMELAATDYNLKKHYDFKLIEIKKEYEQNLPLVPCEKAKIQQVLLNILRNGAQAMQKAGTKNPQFIIRTRNKDSDGFASIEIEDNGPGIEENICKRIFEPFFTTKPVGEGTGLGLSVSYFIITENHKGKMGVESIPEVMTKFIIKLPVERFIEY